MSALIPHRRAPIEARLNQIQPDDYYPALSVEEWRNYYRVDDTLSAERAHTMLSNATALIQAELDSWREQQTTATLPERLHISYRQAVYQRAKAHELEQYRDIDTTSAGEKHNYALELRINTALQRSREALHRLKGSTRIMVALV